MEYSFFFESKFREFDDIKFLRFQTTDGTVFSMSEAWIKANRKKKVTALQKILFRKENNYDRLYRISVQTSLFGQPEAKKFTVSRRTNGVSTSITILLKKYRKLKFRDAEHTNVYDVLINKRFFTEVFRYRIIILRDLGPPELGFSYSGTDSISSLSDDLCTLLGTNLFCDVTLTHRISKDELKAHRNILQSGSVYFERMFAGPWKEYKGEVDFKMTSMATMKELVYYIYTGTIRVIDFDSLYNLYIAADMYLLWDLRKRLSVEITKYINPQTVVAVLLLAHGYSELDMKTACLNMISENVDEVSHTECWTSLADEDELSGLVPEINEAINERLNRELRRGN